MSESTNDAIRRAAGRAAEPDEPEPEPEATDFDAGPRESAAAGVGQRPAP